MASASASLGVENGVDEFRTTKLDPTREKMVSTAAFASWVPQCGHVTAFPGSSPALGTSVGSLRERALAVALAAPRCLGNVPTPPDTNYKNRVSPPVGAKTL